jgi:hypothetical protein
LSGCYRSWPDKEGTIWGRSDWRGCRGFCRIPLDDPDRRRSDVKSVREMTADTEAYRQEIKWLVETNPEAKILYLRMKAELVAARQVRAAQSSLMNSRRG